MLTILKQAPCWARRCGRQRGTASRWALMLSLCWKNTVQIKLLLLINRTQSRLSLTQLRNLLCRRLQLKASLTPPRKWVLKFPSQPVIQMRRSPPPPRWRIFQPSRLLFPLLSLASFWLRLPLPCLCGLEAYNLSGAFSPVHRGHNTERLTRKT